MREMREQTKKRLLVIVLAIVIPLFVVGIATMATQVANHNKVQYTLDRLSEEGVFADCQVIKKIEGDVRKHGPVYFSMTLCSNNDTITVSRETLNQFGWGGYGYTPWEIDAINGYFPPSKPPSKEEKERLAFVLAHRSGLSFIKALLL